MFVVFISPEPKAQGELIVYGSSRRLCVCVSVCLSVCVSVNILKLKYLRTSEKLTYNVVNTLAPLF